VDQADASAGTIPIGRPIANTRVHVVDPFGQPVPVGVPGELLIGGSGVARGYLNRPALTAQRFQPDPFGPVGGIVYRTGDIVRWRPDGALDFLGRADHQVKVRGFRIELGEVEKALIAQPGVRAAVVTTREDGPGERRLIGYLVPDGATVSIAEVRAALRRELPEYMVPSLLVPLEALPLTHNGKIDRAALPVPDGGREQSAAPFEAPRDDLERSLAETWGRVLRLPTEQIGVHDSFFDLGGDSLKAFTVVSQLRRRLAVDLPLAAFLADPTIGGLSGSVRTGHAATPAPVLITLLDDPPNVPELVLVHPLGGHVFAYQLLAARLRGRIRLTVVRARGVERGETPYRSIREMASHYLAELRRDRPDGGYHLGGWCLGGAIAHEMAVQLRETGTPAAGLIAISSSALDEGLKGLADDHLALATFAVTGHRLDGAGEDQAAGHADAAEQLAADRRAALATLAGLRDLDEDSQLERLVSLASTTEALRPDITSVADARTLMRIYRAHQHALQDHRPRPYRGEMHLIKPSRCHLPDTPAGDLGWGPVTGALRVHPVAGTHYSILEKPAVDELADALVALVAPDPVTSAGPGRAAAGPSR
jgi:thioesterase domain-containing protein